MNNASLKTGSIVALAIAIVAWGSVGVFAFELLQLQDERASYSRQAVEANLQQGQAARLHALARETADDRLFLENSANVDVLSAVNMIEAVSNANAKVEVTGAQAEKNAAKPGPVQINTVSLNVRVDGPFAAIMRTLQTIENLPLATMVQTVDMVKGETPVGVKNPVPNWSLNIRLRFLTTVPLPA